MTTTINASPTNGLVATGDGSGVLKVQSNGVTTNALAWVNFNGVTTTSIRASYNVSSITRNGAGDYTINFATALADANYAIAGVAKYNSTATNAWRLVALYSNAAYSSVVTTTSVRVMTMYANGTAPEDTEAVMVNVFGN